MPRKKIPNKIRKTLKKSLKSEGGELAESVKIGKRNIARSVRSLKKQGKIKRTEISWTVDVGDLIKVKKSCGYQIAGEIGIVIAKRKTTNYLNQQDEKLTIMTNSSSNYLIHPKYVECIQKNEENTNLVQN
jgi:hypothetical protein